MTRISGSEIRVYEIRTIRMHKSKAGREIGPAACTIFTDNKMTIIIMINAMPKRLHLTIVTGR